MRENLEIVFDKNGIVAGFTNRLGGVSEAKFSSLNLGDHVGDEQEMSSKIEKFWLKI